MSGPESTSSARNKRIGPWFYRLQPGDNSPGNVRKKWLGEETRKKLSEAGASVIDLTMLSQLASGD